MQRLLTVALAALLCGALATMAQAEDWPQFRGLNRDGISPEKGLMQKWPDGGPKELWSNSEIGFGWSSVAISKGKIYTLGNVTKAPAEGEKAPAATAEKAAETTAKKRPAAPPQELFITCLDLGGKKLWQQNLGLASKGGQHAGARSTVTVAGDKLVVLADTGVLMCLKAEDGKEIWKVSFTEKFGAKAPTWAFAESPLVDGDRVVVSPGGSASMAAFNLADGKPLWTTEPVDELTNYASAIIVNCGGLKQYINFSKQNAFGVHAETGKLLWKQAHKTKYDVNATSALFDAGILYLTSGYGTGGEAFKMEVADGNVKLTSLWTSKSPDDQMGGVILAGGVVYGTGHNLKGLTALKLTDGSVVFTNKEVGQSSLIFADGRLIVQGYDGTVRLVDPADGKVISQFKIAMKDSTMWAIPAVSDGKLYIHHESTLTAYDIAQPK